jgi:23S rRNA pseudouridine2605 synthase
MQLTRQEEYLVVAQGSPASGDASRVEKGLLIEGRKTRAARCEIPERYEGTTPGAGSFSVRGRNRQIRRMFDHLDHPVASHRREWVGSVRLGEPLASSTRAERERTMWEGKARRPI